MGVRNNERTTCVSSRSGRSGEWGNLITRRLSCQVEFFDKLRINPVEDMRIKIDCVAVRDGEELAAN